MTKTRPIQQDYQEQGLAFKTIYVVVSGAGDDEDNYHTVKLAPGTTALDVLTRVNLRGFQLGLPDGGYFAPEDDVYSVVDNGWKLYAVKDDVKAGVASDATGATSDVAEASIRG